MVICHTSVPHTFDSIVHAFHMPVFFIVSGWCFNADKNSKVIPFIKKRVKTLVVPYFFWAVVLFSVWQILFAFYDRARMFPIDEFLYYLLYSNAEYSPFCSVQWFLTAMFFASLIGSAVINLFKNSLIKLLISTAGLMVLGWALPHILPVRLPLALDVAVSSSAFFVAGWLIPNRIIPKLSQRIKRILISPVTLVFTLAAGTAAAYFNGYVNMRLMDFKDPVLFYLSAIMLSLALMHISFFFCRLPARVLSLPLFYGKNTLQILIFNQLFIQIIKLFNPLFSYAVWFLCAVGVMVIMIPVILFTNKFLPYTLGKTKKKA